MDGTSNMLEAVFYFFFPQPPRPLLIFQVIQILLEKNKPYWDKFHEVFHLFFTENPDPIYRFLIENCRIFNTLSGPKTKLQFVLNNQLRFCFFP